MSRFRILLSFFIAVCLLLSLSACAISPEFANVSSFLHLGDNYIGLGTGILLCFNSSMELISDFKYHGGEGLAIISDNYFVVPDGDGSICLLDSSLNELTDEYPNIKNCYYEKKSGYSGHRLNQNRRLSVFDDDGLKCFDITENVTYSDTTYTLTVYDLKTEERITDIVLDRALSSTDKFETCYIGEGYLYSAPYLINYKNGNIVDIGFTDLNYAEFFCYNHQIYLLDNSPGRGSIVTTCYDLNGTELWEYWDGSNYDISTGEEIITFDEIEEREGHYASIKPANIHSPLVKYYGLQDYWLSAEHYITGYSIFDIENENGEYIVLADRKGNFLLGPYKLDDRSYCNLQLGYFCAKYGFMIEATNNGFCFVGKNGKKVDIPQSCVYGDISSNDFLEFGLKSIIGIENGIVYFNNMDKNHGRDVGLGAYTIAVDISSIL